MSPPALPCALPGWTGSGAPDRRRNLRAAHPAEPRPLIVGDQQRDVTVGDYKRDGAESEAGSLPMRPLFRPGTNADPKKILIERHRVRLHLGHVDPLPCSVALRRKEPGENLRPPPVLPPSARSACRGRRGARGPARRNRRSSSSVRRESARSGPSTIGTAHSEPQRPAVTTSAGQLSDPDMPRRYRTGRADLAARCESARWLCRSAGARRSRPEAVLTLERNSPLAEIHREEAAARVNEEDRSETGRRFSRGRPSPAPRL